MPWFLIGLPGFLGLHSVRIVAPAWREARIAAMGEKAWKGVYSLLAIAFFVLMIRGYGQMGHPMILGVKTWAFAHLLMSGWLHAMLLFGAFLLWAVVDFGSARSRPREAPGKSNAAMTVVALIVGIAFAAVFAMYLHGMLIGVKPFSMPMR